MACQAGAGPVDRAEQTLGTSDDALDADGKTILNYSQAQEEARTWLKTLEYKKKDGEPATYNYSVENALDDYLADYKRRSNRATKDLKARIDSQIKPALGKLVLSKLTKKRVRDWHGSFADVGARLRTTKDKDQKYKEFDSGDDEHVRKRRATANRLLSDPQGRPVFCGGGRQVRFRRSMAQSEAI